MNAVTDALILPAAWSSRWTSITSKYVSDGGGDSPENLLPLCPNCHALHHQGHIPRESLRTWKLLLLALNEGFDRRSVDTLLALDVLDGVMVWGDALLPCAALIALGFLEVKEQREIVEQESLFFGRETVNRVSKYWIELSPRGRAFGPNPKPAPASSNPCCSLRTERLPEGGVAPPNGMG